MNKNYLAIIPMLLLIILLGGFWFLYRKDQQETTPEKPNTSTNNPESTPSANKPTNSNGKMPIKDFKNVEEILSTIQYQSQIAFGPIKVMSFKWVTNTKGGLVEEEIVGKGFEAYNIHTKQATSINTYLENVGFEPDVANFGSGTTRGRVAYTNGKYKCVIDIIDAEYVKTGNVSEMVDLSVICN